jgi:hypothetical protein
MAEGDVHTYYENGLWKNRIEGGRRASNTAVRRNDAVSVGRWMARDRRVDHLVHDAGGGEVVERRSYRRATTR